MLKKIGAVLGGPAPQGAKNLDRERHPVRRGSRLVGTCEGGFWCRTGRQEVRRVLLAARRYELAGRVPGRRNGPLGHVAIEVLELLANVVEFRSGRLEPSYAYLTKKLKRSRDAVSRALDALRAHGFLDWMRRHEKLDAVQGPGPRVRQVTNAYRLSLPPRAARFLGRYFSAPPLPDDVVQEQADRAAWVQVEKDALSPSELALMQVEDSLLAQALSRMGRFLEARARVAQERESARQEDNHSTP